MRGMAFARTRESGKVPAQRKSPLYRVFFCFLFFLKNTLTKMEMAAMFSGFSRRHYPVVAGGCFLWNKPTVTRSSAESPMIFKRLERKTVIFGYSKELRRFICFRRELRSSFLRRAAIKKKRDRKVRLKTTKNGELVR